MGRPGQHGRPRAEERDEAADEDCLGAVPLKGGMCPRKMRFVEVKDTPIPSHQRDAACTPNPVAAVVADDGRGDRGRDDRGDRQVPERGKGRGGDQGGLARKRGCRGSRGSPGGRERRSRKTRSCPLWSHGYVVLFLLVSLESLGIPASGRD